MCGCDAVAPGLTHGAPSLSEPNRWVGAREKMSALIEVRAGRRPIGRLDLLIGVRRRRRRKEKKNAQDVGRVTFLSAAAIAN